jgi:hypothetical protein
MTSWYQRNKERAKELGRQYRERQKIRQVASGTTRSVRTTYRADGRLSLDSDEMQAYLAACTPIEVHLKDGRVIHTSLSKLGQVMEERKAELKRGKGTGADRDQD